MKLTPEAIAEYKALHEANYGEVITLEEAEVYANRTMALVQYIFNSNVNEKSRPPKSAQ